VLWLPPVPLEPDQPPEAVQLVASVDDQLSVAALPLVMDDGDAVRETEGAGGGGMVPGGEPPEFAE